jgi:hypothetical protein
MLSGPTIVSITVVPPTMYPREALPATSTRGHGDKLPGVAREDPEAPRTIGGGPSARGDGRSNAIGDANPFGIAVDQATNTICTANILNDEGPGTVSVINGATYNGREPGRFRTRGLRFVKQRAAGGTSLGNLRLAECGAEPTRAG